MRYLFCGGGTAGHISPAIALAEYIKKKDKNASIAFVGRLDGRENDAIKKEGYLLYEIEIYGFIRKISLENIKNIFRLRKALKKSKQIIKDFTPDIVIGTGGYVSWPVINAAHMLKIPTIIHESNSYPGLVTRMLSKKADRILLCFESANTRLKSRDNVKIVGNPVKSAFYTTPRESSRRKYRLFKNDILISSVGGSGGALRLNAVIADFMESFSLRNENIKHIHSTGRRYYNEVIKEHPELKKESRGVCLKPYINDMPCLLKASDIVISRSGAMTLAELAVAGAVPILIPSPNVTDNHQYYNAKYLQDRGCAVVIEERELSLERLMKEVRGLIDNPKRLNEMRRNLLHAFPKKPEETIYKEILSIMKSAL